MADDWQVGDLAVRIEKDDLNGISGAPPLGKIVRVIDVVERGGWPWGGIAVEGYPSPRWTRAWCDTQYRKIRPDAHEDCEPEFVTLLKRLKRPVSA